jgi:hypothetical protein
MTGGIAQSPIRGDELYSLAFVKASIGLKDHSLRKARREGLRIHYCGKNGWVRGADLIEYICGASSRGDDNASGALAPAA